MKMKVAFYMSTILENYGGTEKYFFDTVKNLNERYNDIDVSIITLDNNFSENIVKAIAALKFKKSNLNGLYKVNILEFTKDINYIKCENFPSLKEELAKYDIIYSKNEILESIILKFFVGYGNIKKLIFGCHTSLYYKGRNLHNFLYNSVIYRYLTSGVSRFHVLNSNDYRLLNNYHKDVVLIPNPINYKQYIDNLLKYNSHKFLNINVKIYNIAWIGRLSEDKGVGFLKEIISNLSNSGKTFNLHIAGDGELNKEICLLSDSLSCIHYHGHIENTLIPKFLSNMNLLLITSKGESFGLSIIEANMSNVPALSLNVSGSKDIIVNGINGFLAVDKKEYIEKLYGFIDGKHILLNSKEYIVDKFKDINIYNSIYDLLMR